VSSLTTRAGGGGDDRLGPQCRHAPDRLDPGETFGVIGVAKVHVDAVVGDVTYYHRGGILQVVRHEVACVEWARRLEDR